jgi:hypothetical protein
MEDTHTKCPVASEVRTIARSLERSLMLMYQSCKSFTVDWRHELCGQATPSVPQGSTWVFRACIIYTSLQGRPKLTTQNHSCEHDKIAAARDFGKILHSHRPSRTGSEILLHWKLRILHPYLFSKLTTKVNCWIRHTLSTNADAMFTQWQDWEREQFVAHERE